MKPRFRLAYSAILCSFIPYCSRMAFERYAGRQLTQLPECTVIGMANGMILMGLCLSTELPFVASAAVVGGIYGALYSKGLNYFVNKDAAEISEKEASENQYVDKSFKL